MKAFFEFSDKIKSASDAALIKARAKFDEIDAIAEYNQQKVLSAFINNRVSETDFAGSTGYGYGDTGREKLDRIYADIFGAEDAIVRHSFTCGTHTLAVALFGILRPGDTMLGVTGTPYDTIHSVIGLSGEGMGSLKEFGVSYAQVDLKADGRPDLEAIAEAVKSNTILSPWSCASIAIPSVVTAVSTTSTASFLFTHFVTAIFRYLLTRILLRRKSSLSGR